MCETHPWIILTFINDSDKMKIYYTLTEIPFNGVLIQMCTEMALGICNLSKSGIWEDKDLRVPLGTFMLCTVL